MQAKKKNALALCLCVLLMGNFQAYRLTGIRLFLGASIPQIAWAAMKGDLFDAAQSARHLPAPQLLTRFQVLFHYPQPGLFYEQVCLLIARAELSLRRDSKQSQDQAKIAEKQRVGFAAGANPNSKDKAHE